MPQHVKFHLTFSFVMGALMISIMTGIITAANIGVGEGFIAHWVRAFAIAYVVGVPAIFFLAPVARRMTARLLGVAG